ncbi:MAG: rhodanese-like domain-containing protein [Nitrospirae bacterium]|nr:rhodanese-like domain-containing protein [Nitrospirota bacterium]
MKMKRIYLIFSTVVLSMTLIVPSVFAAEDMAAKLNAELMKAPKENHWQIKTADVAKMIAGKKTDFLVVDVRPTPPGQQGGKIPGSMYIPYSEILKADNLKKLPKDKKIILVCVTGQTQNLPVLALRALGYKAYTMPFGMSSWVKGYLGAKFMQDAIKGADTGNYPVEK